MKSRRMLAILTALAMMFSATAVYAADEAPANEAPVDVAAEEAVTVTGTQVVVIEGFDWGPGVSKTILSLGAEIDPASVKAGNFEVLESKEAFDWAVLFAPPAAQAEEAPAEEAPAEEAPAEQAPAEEAPAEEATAEEAPAEAVQLPFGHAIAQASRQVVAAYACDENGKAVTEASTHIALELYCDPNNGSPYCYDIFSGMNTVCLVYDLGITLKEGCTLKDANGHTVEALDIAPACDLKNAIVPQLEGVDLTGSFTGTDGKTLTYGSYEPDEDGKKHPLVIWLHGAGEGGTDPSIAILGNKVSALYENDFQDVMGGAYVLTPQTPTFWLAYDEEGNWNDNPGTDSIYLPTLMELIQDYVAKHESVDPERIYVGGCSNGGYMTMDLILNYPDYFAAAFPICEAYKDSGITDEQIEGLKDLPIWFVYAENDTVVDPAVYEIPTIERMKAAGCDIHTSIFQDVHDTSGLYKDPAGAPYQYMGHWSWLYFFNDECEEDGLSMWEWMADCAPVEAGVVTGRQHVVIEGYDWGPGVNKTILKLNQAVDPETIEAEDFTVVESKESFDWSALFGGGAAAGEEKPKSKVELPFGHAVAEAPRQVTAAYACDANGEEVSEASEYIALELLCDPNNGSPYCYDIFSGMNTVCLVYDLNITLAEESGLAAADGTKVASFAVNPTARLKKASVPQLEGVDLTGRFTGSDGKTLTYGSYEPEEDGEYHPLVIWLHGAGEGGTDPSIANLGNKVSALYGEEFQEAMDGAYVLTPQTPTFWLAYTEEGAWNDNPGTDSIYLPTLMELIEDYVENHEFVDPFRIYVGGCSNGGYMTMDLILNYPDYFAAAFPICEAYKDAGITDEQIAGIKELPVWFVYAENDTVVDPTVYEIPTIERMKAAGCDVHTSIFPDVHDTTGEYKDAEGNPYQYMGHWSWLYFFNNECEEDGVNMWAWMAAQTLEN
ncbi:MAG: prolyl oligopeptidase family serine peptidase [Lachnospiraceae bacterium]|nr:prolyl oligopeptidase family serine peptidase [Lachnospiraceae bacterium]